MAERFSAAVRYIRQLLANPYFWGGITALLIIGAILYIALNFFIMPSVTRHDAFVTVPDVRNYQYSDAESVLRQAGLEVEQVNQRYTPSAPRDAVVDQNPNPDARVKPGRRVYLSVNSGQQAMVRVPRLEDLSVREATSRLAALGLRAGELRPDSIPSPYPNTITRQSPAPGDSLPEGGTVRLWYSTGLGTSYVTMPDVTGLPLQEAEQMLLDARLRYVIIGADEIEDPSEEIVQRQSREPGTRVREGFEIRLFVGEEDPQPDQQIEY